MLQKYSLEQTGRLLLDNHSLFLLRTALLGQHFQLSSPLTGVSAARRGRHATVQSRSVSFSIFRPSDLTLFHSIVRVLMVAGNGSGFHGTTHGLSSFKLGRDACPCFPGQAIPPAKSRLHPILCVSRPAPGWPRYPCALPPLNVED